MKTVYDGVDQSLVDWHVCLTHVWWRMLFLKKVVSFLMILSSLTALSIGNFSLVAGGTETQVVDLVNRENVPLIFRFSLHDFFYSKGRMSYLPHELLKDKRSIAPFLSIGIDGAQEVRLEPGESKAVALTVKAPLGSEHDGTYQSRLQIEARGLDGAAKQQEMRPSMGIDLVLFLKERLRPALKVESITLAPNSSDRLRVRIRNTGNCVVRGNGQLKLTLQNAEEAQSWTVKLESPEIYPSDEATQSQRLLEVKIPPAVQRHLEMGQSVHALTLMQYQYDWTLPPITAAMSRVLTLKGEQ